MRRIAYDRVFRTDAGRETKMAINKIIHSLPKLKIIFYLFDKDFVSFTEGAELGEIGKEQLQFLIDHLEEENPEDQDYWLRAETLELLENRGADAGLMALLRQAMGEREGFEIRWSRPVA